MAIYSKIRFDIARATNHPNQQLYYPSMESDKNEVMLQAGYTTGKWLIAKCLTHLESPNNADHAIGQKYPIFVGYNASNEVLKKVAAPCPPFCTDDAIG